MTFQSSTNPSNIHFQNTSGSSEVADRLRQYPIGTTLNLGITYSGSLLSIAGSDGTALSATNPGYVILSDKSSPGLKKIFTVTANQGFIDATGASEIINNLFGLNTSVAYGQDLPFFSYAVSNDAMDAVAFMISRVPNRQVSPAIANIGAPDDAVADTPGSFFSFDNIDETLYDENPCAAIGSFRMRMSAADDWTVQALNDYDGIGRWNEQWFTMVTGQFGATAGKYFADNGGTGPVWNTNNYVWTINKSGLLTIAALFQTNSIVGAGAVAAFMSSPYIGKNSGGAVAAAKGLIAMGANPGWIAFDPAVSRGAFIYFAPAITQVTNAIIGNNQFQVDAITEIDLG